MVCLESKPKKHGQGSGEVTDTGRQPIKGELSNNLYSGQLRLYPRGISGRPCEAHLRINPVQRGQGTMVFTHQFPPVSAEGSSPWVVVSLALLAPLDG